MSSHEVKAQSSSVGRERWRSRRADPSAGNSSSSGGGSERGDAAFAGSAAVRVAAPVVGRVRMKYAGEAHDLPWEVLRVECLFDEPPPVSTCE